jgi:hypothetical protein
MIRQVQVLVICAFTCITGCTSRDTVQTQHTRAMTIEAAAKRLSEISGQTVRGFSTRDFGRGRNPEARSIVVLKTRTQQVLEQIRSELGPKLIAFVGTTQWLGDEKHIDGEEIVIANADSQFDILRVAQTDAVNYEMGTEDLIKKLTEYNRSYGIDIFHAETDTIVFRFSKLPNDMPRFCKDLYKFCPDIVDQGVGTVEALEKEIRKTQEVFLWWD